MLASDETGHVFVGIVTPKMGGGDPYWNDFEREELRNRYNEATLSKKDRIMASVFHVENIRHTLALKEAGGREEQQNKKGCSDEKKEAEEEDDDDEILGILQALVKKPAAVCGKKAAREAEAARLSTQQQLAAEERRLETESAILASRRMVETSLKPQMMDFGAMFFSSVVKSAGEGKHFDPEEIEKVLFCNSATENKKLFSCLHCEVGVGDDLLEASQNLLAKTGAMSKKKSVGLKAQCDALIQARFGAPDRIKLVLASTVVTGTHVYALRARSTATAKQQWCSSQAATIERWHARLHNDAGLDEEVRRLIADGGKKGRRC
jgi:hypothetical protein